MESESLSHPSQQDSIYRFRAATPGDAAELVELFNRSFAANGAHEDSSTWRWRYGSNGATQCSIVAEHETSGRLAGHMGNVPLRTWCHGESRRTSVSLHHMVAPERRRGLQKTGLLAGMVRHWIDHFNRPEHDFIGWGFPNSTNYRVGHEFNEYTVVRNINALVALDPSTLRASPSSLKADVSDSLPEDVDGLWHSVRGEIEMGVERDGRYLRWRYEQHPAFRYEVLSVRDSDNTLRALAVSRMAADQDDVLMLLEWLVPTDDGEASSALLDAVARLAERRDAGAVSAWFPEPQPWFDRFQDVGFRVRYTPTIWVARSGDPHIGIAEVRQGFYATYGDVDYY